MLFPSACCLLLVSFFSNDSLAGEVKLAVAANFVPAMRDIATSFESLTGHRVILSAGSTGKLYAQISNGAPFDMFLAADARRPKLLEAQGAGMPDTRFTYAVGRLVLWSMRDHFVDSQAGVLNDMGSEKLAIANPKLAPYGAAAQSVLESLGLWDVLQKRVVKGENISQTYTFVRTGNAALGFVAQSQLVTDGKTGQGSGWVVPEHLHEPIEQQGILLVASAPAMALHAYLQDAEARAIISSYGYQLP